MDIKTEILSSPEGGMEVRMTFDRAMVELMCRDIHTAVREEATRALAAKFVADKGSAIIASIDLKDVLNSTVAKVVTRLSEDSRK